MEKIKLDDLLKLATHSEKAKKALISMAKIADGGQDSGFNETVPAMSEDQAAYQNGQKQQQPPPEAAQEAAPQDESAAVPMEEPAPAEGPEAIGARAAQNFIGAEVMSAAMQGDPNAADIIARTAGQVAAATTESAMKAVPAAGETPTAGVPALGAEEGGAVVQGAEAVPAAAASPEEDLANEIVPPVEGGAAQGQMDQGKAPQTGVVPANNQGPVPAQEGETPNPGGEDQKVDLKTVAKMIQAAKAGKL